MERPNIYRDAQAKVKRWDDTRGWEITRVEVWPYMARKEHTSLASAKN